MSGMGSDTDGTESGTENKPVGVGEMSEKIMKQETI